MNSQERWYFSCAFPTLFPTKAADFLGQRQNQVTVGNYFKHLMMYGDGWFAKHPRFQFFALNTEMHWHALQIGQICIHQKLVMHRCHWMSFKAWLDRKEKLFPTVCYTML